MDIILILCILLLVYCIFYADIVYAKSNKDGNFYIIRRGHSKSDEFLTNSANTLAEINIRVERLIEYLHTRYQNDSSKNYFIQKLRENYNYSILSEAEVDPRYTTYTVDKEDMHICLRTRDNNENIYDINTLMYVVLHELSHLCNYAPDGTAILGHGESFVMIFRFLVREAVNIGIYNYVDYTRTPQSYCGILISSQILN